ncbi:hypothetical protein ACWGK7_00670 [Sphingomonas aurantiaca]
MAISYLKATTPAKAGVKLGTVTLAKAAHRYPDLPTWAPASAGVAAGRVAGGGVAAGGVAAVAADAVTHIQIKHQSGRDL